MNNLAYQELEETGEIETCKPVLAYSRDETSARANARLVESIVDYLLANGSMPV